uniref:Cytochrome P450 n=1 Tax=Clastoptera arizonana TaxID=38151 RepID=A0A1B6CZU1_9HEMI
MDILETLIFAALSLIFVLFLLDAKRPYKYPPGPSWLPIIGNYFLFKSLKDKHRLTILVWEKLKEYYGPLLGVRLGKDRIVIVSGKELVRELLTKEELEGRPDGFIFRLRAFGEKLGVVFTDGAFGFEQRKFFLKHVRELGFGRSVMEDNITKETTQFISLLNKKFMEGPVSFPKTVEIFIVNNLWRMLAGKRFSETDRKLDHLLSLIHEAFKLQDMSGGLLNQMPFIRFIAPEKSTYNRAVKIIRGLLDFIKETVEEHKKTFSPTRIRDFIDAFLLEMQNCKDDPHSSFTEKQLLVLLMDMIMAGSDSTTNALTFAIIYMINYPYIQRHIQAEMDAVVGRDRCPTLQDRPKLPYTDATLMEVLRVSNIGATTVAHRAKKDFFVNDYIIPKNSIVLFNLYSVHMDKQEWGDPEIFRPERFLDERGNLVLKESLIPFSLGRRRCLGETLSRPTLFLFLTSLLHNFVIESPQGLPPPSMEPIDGAILSAIPFQCVLIPRGK